VNHRFNSDGGDGRAAPEPSPDRGNHGSAPSPDPVTGFENNATPPALPQEPVADRRERKFVCDDVEWVAYVSGRGAYGTGHWGLASLQAIHFARADTPEKPEYEALIAAGRFADLYASELLELFHSARRIVIPEGGVSSAPRRFNREEDLP
jgi:hypothetical protein